MQHPRPAVRFSPDPAPPRPLRQAAELVHQVKDGERKVKLVFGNGVSKLPVHRPAEIVVGLRRALHDRRECLRRLTSGEFQSEFNAGRCGDDELGELNLFLKQTCGTVTVKEVERSIWDNRALFGKAAAKVTTEMETIEKQCLNLGQQSPRFLTRLWHEYEKARFVSKKLPPAAFALLALLIVDGHVDCVVTPNYDCYLSSVLERLEWPYAQNPCLKSSDEWSYDGFLSIRPSDTNVLRVWKVFGDLDFARYSCGHVVKLPERLRLDPPPIDPSREWIKEAAATAREIHAQIASQAGSQSDPEAPYCCPEDHDLRFHEGDVWKVYQPLHLVDFNWPARHRVFGKVIEEAKQDLGSEPEKSLILVLGYSGNDDPIASKILELANDVPVVHILASTRRFTHLTGITSRLWVELQRRSLAFRFMDDMTSRRTQRIDKNELMKPLRTLLEQAELYSLAEIRAMENRLRELWRAEHG